MEFNNQSGLEFTDIVSEEYRYYDFPGGYRVVIPKPTHLNVSSKGHRIFDEDGMCHYIPMGWIHLAWKAKEGAPHFVK